MSQGPPNLGSMQEKSQKKGFSNKALARIDFFSVLFYVPMNPLKPWNDELEAGISWPSKNLYRQCV